MNKWIRWQGLFGFVVALMVLLLFFLLLIDHFIQDAIETTGSQITGARVELDGAELRFSPLGIRLGRLQIADPDHPLHNIIDIEQIDFNLDGNSLLRRKALINEMRVSGVKFNTTRTSSGTLNPQDNQQKNLTSAANADNAKLPDITIPDADEVLKREALSTTRLAEQVRAGIKSRQQDWDKIKKVLPAKTELVTYQTRLQKLRQTDTRDAGQLNNAIRELKRIKKELESDLEVVEASRQKIESDLTQLGRDLKAMQTSPDKDYKRLTEKYSVRTNTIGNISQLLFGEDAQRYTALAISWYKKLQPMLTQLDSGDVSSPQPVRHRGMNIRFREQQPAPDFFIKLARVTVQTAKGNFAGTINNISNAQYINAQAMTLYFSGQHLQDMGAIQLSGSFNHIKRGQIVDRLKLSMTDYPLNQHHLVDKPDMRIYLDKARCDIRLQAWRINNRLKADFSSHIHSIQYNNQATGNELAMMFLTSINKTRDFTIEAKLRGEMENYTTHVSSDLDDHLRTNMQRHIERRLADFRRQLQKKIHLQTRQPITDTEGRYKNLLSGIKNDIAIRKAWLTRDYNAAAADLKQLERQAKQKNPHELKSKLKDLVEKYK